MRLGFEAVTCSYGGAGQPVLTSVSFSVGPGLWLVVGPNGAGKSTLLRCAAGLLAPLRGRLLWNGANAYRLAGRYRFCLGYAPQEIGGYPELTVREYLGYLGALKGILPGRLPARVGEMLTETGLADAAGCRIADLSGGQKTRLGLAQALLNDPDLLLLDEPTAGLDIAERVRFRNLLQDLSRDRIILMATNVPDDVAGVADGSYRLADGQLAAFED